MTKSNRGFSLVELIVVMAILAVLVGILTPQLSKYIARSKASTCKDTREAIAQAYRTYVVQRADQLDTDTIGEGEGKTPIATIYGECVADAFQIVVGKQPVSDGVYTYQGICKGGGTYTCHIDAQGKLTINCDCEGHDGVSVDGVPLQGTNGGDREPSTPTKPEPPKTPDSSFMSSVKDVIGSLSGLPNSIDAGAQSNPTSNAHRMVQALKDAGIDLNENGIGTWLYYKSGDTYLTWTPFDLNTMGLSAGKQIPVIRYNLNKGTYAVLYSTVQIKTSEYGAYTSISTSIKEYTNPKTTYYYDYEDVIAEYEQKIATSYSYIHYPS